jgi:hypothetical protein
VVDLAIAAGADIDGVGRHGAEGGLHLGFDRVLGLEDAHIADARPIK